MRILQLRFKNLNSLLGEWAIDLSDPAFSADGIFAITGPTGAGKSTILDAICLALYGRTPRLGKITLSSNEIMSRQAGMCFAEVCFETQAGRFRVHWQQRRAKKSAAGKLQPPKHEVADLDSGKIIESSLAGVATYVEQISGMDFERFTRSMLLAQGGFAAFLQASANHRAPILEQITGTAIYSQISIQIHQRYSEQKQKRDVVQAQLAGIKVLSPVEIDGLEKEKTGLSEQQALIGQKISTHQSAINWFERIRTMQAELKRRSDLRADLNERHALFGPQRSRLELANRALELGGLFAEIDTVRKNIARDQQHRSPLQRELPQLKTRFEESEKKLATSIKTLDQQRHAQQTAIPLLLEVRALDVTLAEQLGPILSAKEIKTAQDKNLLDERAEQETNRQAIQSAGDAFKALDRQIIDSQKDEILVGQLAGLLARLDALSKLVLQRDANGIQLSEHDSLAKVAASDWQTCQRTFRDAGERHTSTQQALLDAEHELAELLQTQNLAALRESQGELSERSGRLERLSDGVERQSKNLISQRNARQRLADLLPTLARGEKQHRADTEVLNTHERQLELLETERQLQQNIRNLDEHRQHLQDGTPCPLCGALEHPFTIDQMPVEQETEQKLASVRIELRNSREKLRELEIQKATLQQEKQQIETRDDSLQQEIDADEHTIISAMSSVELASALNERKTAIAAKQLETRNRWSQISDTLQRAKPVEQTINDLQKRREKLREVLADAERASATANNKREAANAALSRVQTQLSRDSEQLLAASTALRADLVSLGIEHVPSDAKTIAALADTLSRRRDQWLGRQKRQLSLGQQQTGLNKQAEHIANNIRRAETLLLEQGQRLKQMQQTHDTVKQKRRQLFDDQDPAQHEEKLAQLSRLAESDTQGHRASLDELRQLIDRQSSALSQIESTLKSSETQLDGVRSRWVLRLSDLKFADEADYLSARLGEDERQRLAKQSAQLNDEQIALTQAIKDHQKRLADEQANSVDQQSLAIHQDQLREQETNRLTLQQKIGAIGQQLIDHQAIQAKQAAQTRELTGLQTELERWTDLHSLIGSADGKKFRNFAQGLTFDIVIGHANQQLKKMTSRYLLVRHPDQVLELDIIDAYQAGEIRSTKNLSGGESFIVSLALALGLSQMASNKVRVDSLFLDEGFGTLDEEALDTALDTLSALQQDGKLIGVISHVGALKARISTQIQVRPLAGGISEIVGPGCQRL